MIRFENMDLRKEIGARGLHHCEIADKMGVTRVWFSKLMAQEPMKPSDEKKIRDAMDSLTGKRDDSRTVKHGRWDTEILVYPNGIKHAYYACSVCGKASDDEYDYCPHCGAKMDEVDNGRLD